MIKEALMVAIITAALLVTAVVSGLFLLDNVGRSPWAATPVPTATATPTVTPTATSTVTPTPTPLPTKTPMSERVRVTWYGEAFRGGPLYCGGQKYWPYDPDDPTTVAMGADGPPCGSRLWLCSDSACIIATIKDKCGGCGPGHLDLSWAGWEALGRPYHVDMTILVTTGSQER